MADSLPDSGGAYMDSANGAAVGPIRRTFNSFKSTVMSGETGSYAAKALVGGATVVGIVRLSNSTGITSMEPKA